MRPFPFLVAMLAIVFFGVVAAPAMAEPSLVNGLMPLLGNFLDGFMEPALRWLDAHIVEFLAGVVAFILIKLRAIIARYLSGRAAWFAEQALMIVANRIGDAIHRGLAQSRATEDTERAKDAVAYTQRTMAQSIVRANVTPAELYDRALAEARGASSHLSTQLVSF